MPGFVGSIIGSGYAAVSLSAAPDQTSYYERFGFETVHEDEHAATMVARL